jgi:Ca2+-binding RTX toxin-like protein
MATLYVYNTIVSIAPSVKLGSGDQVMIGAQGFVYSANGNCFDPGAGPVANISMTVQGYMAAFSTGVALGTLLNPVNSSSFLIGKTGTIDANFAFLLNGESLRIQNDGAIHGQSCGIFYNALGTGRTTIENNGTIMGNSAAIQVSSLSTGSVLINNHGSISSLPNAAFTITLGESLSNDILRNSGLITGNVYLGGGNDIYDGRGGGTVEGVINGGAGDDIFQLGAAEEVIVGGDGSDILDFRSSVTGVVLALDGSLDATGWADGDTYTAIEQIFGSRAGGDELVGNSSANKLSSFGGADILAGQAGNDTLEGGNGIDTLSGGNGNDIFLFRAIAQGGDLITDFSSTGAGNDDRFMIVASAFGGGLVAGALAAGQFQIRADNLAQDADGFIFRTTDATLWFDVDGTGAGAAVLVADLQATATMTSLDILLI